MKKIATLTIIALLGITTVFAQDTLRKKYVIAKGTMLMTGSISGSYNKQSNSPNVSGHVSINEQSGHFVANNVAVGIYMGYGYNYNKQIVGNGPFFPIFQRVHRHTINPGVFVRYYKMFTPRFGVMGQFDALFQIGFVNSRASDPLYTFKDRTLGFNLALSPRIIYFVTKKLAVEAGFGSINYSFYKDLNSGADSHNANFSLNPNLQLGMAFYFGKGVHAK